MLISSGSYSTQAERQQVVKTQSCFRSSYLRSQPPACIDLYPLLIDQLDLTKPSDITLVPFTRSHESSYLRGLSSSQFTDMPCLSSPAWYPLTGQCTSIPANEYRDHDDWTRLMRKAPTTQHTCHRDPLAREKQNKEPDHNMPVAPSAVPRSEHCGFRWNPPDTNTHVR